MGCPFCRVISGTVDCFGCFPTPAPTARPQPGSWGDARWSTMPPVHPPTARAAPKSQNPRTPEWRGPQRHLIPPFTRPSCKIVLVWPPCSALCQPLNRWENLQFELHLASSGAKTHRTGFSWPQAKPASSLRHSENRVHWKSAKLQYIGISICQLLNSKTDCLKTESVSYSKFTLNSSPFLHL